MSVDSVPNRDLIEAQNLLQSQQFSEAKVLLEQICEFDKSNINAWFLLSVANGQLGLYEEVIDCCNSIIKQYPKNAPAHVNIGNSLAALGRHEEAAESYQMALNIAPDNAVALNNYGHALFLAEKYEAAINSLRKAIALKPSYADAYHNLANALELTGNYQEAVNNYRMALRINPQLIDSRIKLGDCLREMGSMEEAEACYREGLRVRPDSAEATMGLAVLLRYQAKYDASLQEYERLLKLPSYKYWALAGMAYVYEMKGDKDAAYELITSLEEKGKGNAVSACALTRLCRKFNCCDKAITMCERLLQEPSTTIVGRQMLYYSLGELLDKLGEYDKAFTNFKLANELSPNIYKPDELSNMCQRITMAFSKNTIKTLSRASNYSDRPVFIVGMPRSGTSLVEQILSSHPDVYGAGELATVGELVMSMSGLVEKRITYPECVVALTQRDMNSLSKKYLDELEDLSGDALRVIDKMPHNFSHLGAIALMFPGAKIIHCGRDPLDTCFSIYTKNFNRLHNYATDLGNLGDFYKHYQRLMAHWKQVIDIPLLEIKYEDLVRNHEDISRKMVSFIGLDWDDRCLEFHRSSRAVATASYDQVRQPVYTKSIDRWKNYEKFLEPLITSLKDG